MYMKEEKCLGQKIEYKGGYKTAGTKQVKRVVSNKKKDIHVLVRIEGTIEDFRKAVMDVRKAAREHNRFSDRKMSYDIQLLEFA